MKGHNSDLIDLKMTTKSMILNYPPELMDTIRMMLIPLYYEASRSQSLMKTMELARRMQEIGEQYDILWISNLSKQLMSLLEAFDMNGVLYLLHKARPLIMKLENSISEDVLVK